MLDDSQGSVQAKLISHIYIPLIFKKLHSTFVYVFLVYVQFGENMANSTGIA